jgi:hypothetical protein
VTAAAGRPAVLLSYCVSAADVVVTVTQHITVTLTDHTVLINYHLCCCCCWGCWCGIVHVGCRLEGAVVSTLLHAVAAYVMLLLASRGGSCILCTLPLRLSLLCDSVRLGAAAAPSAAAAAGRADSSNSCRRLSAPLLLCAPLAGTAALTGGSSSSRGLWR